VFKIFDEDGKSASQAFVKTGGWKKRESFVNVLNNDDRIKEYSEEKNYDNSLVISTCIREPSKYRFSIN